MKNPKRLRLRIETITPIHIGGNDELERWEYVYNPSGKYITLLDWNRFEPPQIDELKSNLVGTSDNKKMDFMKYILHSIKDKIKIKDIPLSNNAVIGINSRVYRFIHDGNHKLIIPGSSIKGALLTPQLQEDNPTKKVEGYNVWMSNGEKMYPPFIIRDKYFQNNSKIYKFTRIGMNESRSSLSILKECIPKKSTWDMEVVEYQPDSLKRSISKAREFYYAVFNRLSNELENNKNKTVFRDEINFLNNLKDIIRELPENEAIMVVGQGGSFYSKGTWIYKDTRKILHDIRVPPRNKPKGPPFPRTIFTINGEIPGIIKITLNE